jgi:hypothetical protein
MVPAITARDEKIATEPGDPKIGRHAAVTARSGARSAAPASAAVVTTAQAAEAVAPARAGRHGSRIARTGRAASRSGVPASAVLAARATGMRPDATTAGAKMVRAAVGGELTGPVSGADIRRAAAGTNAAVRMHRGGPAAARARIVDVRTTRRTRDETTRRAATVGAGIGRTEIAVVARTEAGPRTGLGAQAGRTAGAPSVGHRRAVAAGIATTAVESRASTAAVQVAGIRTGSGETTGATGVATAVVPPVSGADSRGTIAEAGRGIGANPVVTGAGIRAATAATGPDTAARVVASRAGTPLATGVTARPTEVVPTPVTGVATAANQVARAVSIGATIAAAVTAANPVARVASIGATIAAVVTAANQVASVASTGVTTGAVTAANPEETGAGTETTGVATGARPAAGVGSAMTGVPVGARPPVRVGTGATVVATGARQVARAVGTGPTIGVAIAGARAANGATVRPTEVRPVGATAETNDATVVVTGVTAARPVVSAIATKATTAIVARTVETTARAAVEPMNLTSAVSIAPVADGLTVRRPRVTSLRRKARRAIGRPLRGRTPRRPTLLELTARRSRVRSKGPNANRRAANRRAGNRPTS